MAHLEEETRGGWSQSANFASCQLFDVTNYTSNKSKLVTDGQVTLVTDTRQPRKQKHKFEVTKAVNMCSYR